METLSNREIFMTVIIAFAAVLTGFLFHKWKHEKQRNKDLEKDCQTRVDTIVSTINFTIGEIEGHLDSISLKARKALDGIQKPLYLGGYSSFVVCLVASSIEHQLCSYIDSMKRNERMHQILHLFKFIPVPFDSDMKPGYIPASFSQSAGASTIDTGWVARFWSLQTPYSEINHSITLISIPRRPPVTSNGTNVAPIAVDHLHEWHDVQWDKIFPEYYHVFMSLQELKDFFESLLKNEKHLKMICEGGAYAVTNENLIAPLDGIRFDQEWLAERQAEKE